MKTGVRAEETREMRPGMLVRHNTHGRLAHIDLPVVANLHRANSRKYAVQ
jgi:hypothetical protein